MFWRRSAKDSRKVTVAQQRASLRALVAGPLSPGLVALRDGRAIGWVSLGPREDFERIVRSRVLPRIDERPVWSIVCFAVSSSARGEGLTGELLDAAIDWARQQRAEALEAYPVDVEPEEPIHPSALYTGALPTFLRAGFDGRLGYGVVRRWSAARPRSARAPGASRLALGSGQIRNLFVLAAGVERKGPDSVPGTNWLRIWRRITTFSRLPRTSFVSACSWAHRSVPSDCCATR